jgi:hypothetical protein
LADAVDGGRTDAEASSDLGLGEALKEPPADKLFLGFVEFGWTPRRRLVQEAIEAIPLVASFPAALGSDRVPKGESQFLLAGQFTLAEHDTDIAQVWQVVEGEPIDRFVAAEDDAVAVAFDKPQAGGNDNAVVG